MKEFTVRTIDFKAGEYAAVSISSVISNYEPPVFTINLGYSASDGDSWSLSLKQLLDLRDMINSHLQEASIPAETVYSNSILYPEEDTTKPRYVDNCKDVPMA